MNQLRIERFKTKRIVIFNHKGGVGKTTLTLNIATQVAKQGKKVLLVDSDPQCNLTLYRIEEDAVEELIDLSETKNGRTLWTALKPIVEGLGEVKIIEPLDLGNNIFLLPGDLRLVEFENELHSLWIECLGRKARGFRGTTGISYLVNEICRKHNFDYVFYDSGPNIGPLNRIIFLDSDYFIIPAACDQFSLSAISTLGETITKWIKDWQTICELAPDDIYLLPGKPAFLGYIPQRFKVWGGTPSGEYAKFFPLIEKKIQEQIISRLKDINIDLVKSGNVNFVLGEVKDFASKAIVSQTTGTAIDDDSFVLIAQKIIERTSN